MMKKTTLLPLALLAIAAYTHTGVRAQGLAVNTTGNTPDTSAILDVSATNKGFLAPRMTKTQRDAIVTPATGLLIYQTDNTPGFYYYNGSAWTASTSTAYWGLTGNAGTGSSNFIGTTDAQPLRLRVNNTWAGEINPSGTNTSFGFRAASVTTGGQNTAVGYQSLSANTSGTANTAYGYFSLGSNATGSSNTAFGYQSLASNTASANTAFGYSALSANTTGGQNTAVGYTCLSNNTTGGVNTAVGQAAMRNNTTGSYNSAFGWQTLISNTTGYENAAYGPSALQANTTGYDNIAMGYAALSANTTGVYNVALGPLSLLNNTTTNYNVAIGYASLLNNTGYQNIGIGGYTLRTNTGGNNIALGLQGLYNNTTGSQNISIGGNNMYTNTTGNYNVAIGFGADVASANLTNAMALGSNASATASNSVVIGSSSVTSIGGFAGWTTLSDGRFKSDIQENVPGLNFIMKLKPVTYHFDARKFDHFIGRPDSSIQQQSAAYQLAERQVRTGFIAQDVETAAKEAGYDFSGVHKPQNDKDNYSVAYAEFTVPLVKAVQEQQKMIADLKKENADLQMQMTEMMNRIKALENK